MRVILQELREIDTGRRALRSFGLVVGGVFIAIGAVVLWRHGWTPGPAVYTLAGIGGALVLLGGAAPGLLKKVYIGWMALALALGFVMTRVLLTIVFFGIVTPLGLVRRLLRKDPMRRAPEPGQTSYWIPKTYPDESPKRLEKLY